MPACCLQSIAAGNAAEVLVSVVLLGVRPLLLMMLLVTIMAILAWYYAWMREGAR